MAYSDHVSLRLRYGIKPGESAVIAALTLAFIFLLCVSLFLVAHYAKPPFHIGFDAGKLVFAASAVAAFACCSILFASAQFSIGFIVSFYLLTIAVGYLWLSYFTPLIYDHATVRVSVVASFIAFAIPALFLTHQMPRRDWITRRQMNLVLYCLMLFSALTAAYGYSSGFYLILDFVEAEAKRGALGYPTWMNYAISISCTTVLPFAYAWFVTQRRYAIAVTVLGLLLLFYPITLNKTVLLTPFWLVALTMLLRFVPAKPAVVLSLMIPMLFGIIVHMVQPIDTRAIFGLINFRMLAIPASGIDHYAHFFSTRPVTGFCQINIIGTLFQCPMPDQLGVMLARVYATGNYNASLFATEGIASVGPYFAPFIALLCGVVIAFGNMASSRLDPAFIFLSGSALVQAVTNIPLSTVMVTHGGALMFLLWFLTPRSNFKKVD